MGPMSIENRKVLDHTSRQRTLCLLFRSGKVLLAEKKRGFGRGKLTGVGGKLETGETLERAAIRETQEEIGVRPVSLRQVAVLDHHFPHNPDWSQRITVFLVEEWEGEPRELGKQGEVRPQWFNIDDLPFASMWDDYRYWLPRVLRGEFLRATFEFGPDNQTVSKSEVHKVSQF